MRALWYIISIIFLYTYNQDINYEEIIKIEKAIIVGNFVYNCCIFILLYNIYFSRSVLYI